MNINSTFFQALIKAAGSILVFLKPNKARELSEKGMTINMKNKLSIQERLMRKAIFRKAEKNERFDSLAEFHHNYWVNQGVDFFELNNTSFESKFLPDCSFIFGLLEVELLNESNEFHTLVEIGTGNGDVLEYLSLKFPKINRFIGVDLSPAQIRINIKKFIDNKKLEFAASDGFEWVKTHGQSNTIFVTSRGVLEYFTGERLQGFLKEINSLGKIIFIAIEPNDIEHNFETNPKSQPYGYERSFSHNYPKLFKNAGFSLWHLSYKPLNESYLYSFIGAKN